MYPKTLRDNNEISLHATTVTIFLPTSRTQTQISICNLMNHSQNIIPCSLRMAMMNYSPLTPLEINSGCRQILNDLLKT